MKAVNVGGKSRPQEGHLEQVCKKGFHERKQSKHMKSSHGRHIQSRRDELFTTWQKMYVHLLIIVFRSIFHEIAVVKIIIVFFYTHTQKEMMSFLATAKGDFRSSFESQKVTLQSLNRQTQKFHRLQDLKQRT